MRRFGFAARACPVCRRRESRLLFRQSFDQLSKARLLGGYDIVVCEACGAAFADDIPEQSVFDEYYRELSKYEEGGGQETKTPVLEQRHRDVADLLVAFIPQGGSRILEMGCGSGQLLSVLRQRGFTNVFGADPSPACAEAARNFHGVPVIAHTIFDIPKPKSPYDLLILTGVMEHIRDLDRAVEQFDVLLNSTGRVYLEVPDASRLEPSADAPFQEFSVEHINYFSPHSLTNLMGRKGFRAVATGRALRPLHEIKCFTAYGLYEKSAAPFDLQMDTETEAGLREYIHGCQAEDAQIRRKIEQALPPGERMIVWGVGAHTLRLLATGGLDPGRISMFVDSDRKYQQQELRGIPVVSPDEVRSRTEPILISSRGFQREIHDQLRRGMGLSNRVILLYEEAEQEPLRNP
jgi:SAM-dependent methyltransferase